MSRNDFGVDVTNTLILFSAFMLMSIAMGLVIDATFGTEMLISILATWVFLFVITLAVVGAHWLAGAGRSQEDDGHESNDINMVRLNMGCGRDIKGGYVNVDMYHSNGVDMVMDLNDFPYPLEDSSVDEIYASHVIEHLTDWRLFMNESYRVLKNGGRLTIKVPYGLSLATYHRHYFLNYTLNEMCVNVGRKHCKSAFYPRMFRMLRKPKVNRDTPGKWWLFNHYNIKLPFHLPIGKRGEIVWELEAVK